MLGVHNFGRGNGEGPKVKNKEIAREEKKRKKKEGPTQLGHPKARITKTQLALVCI